MNNTMLNTLNKKTDSSDNLYTTGFVGRIWEFGGLLFPEMSDAELEDAYNNINTNFQSNPAIKIDKCQDSRDLLIKYTFPAPIPVVLIHPNYLESLAEEIIPELESDDEFSIKFSHLTYQMIERNGTETSGDIRDFCKLLYYHDMYLTVERN